MKLTDLPADLQAAARKQLGTPERKPRRGVMNKTERAYAGRLTMLMGAGHLLWFAFEPFRIRLATGAYYCPDFAVLRVDGQLAFYEVKGFWREAARVRIKVAAEHIPLQFIAVTKHGDSWDYEEIPGLYDTLNESQPDARSTP